MREYYSVHKMDDGTRCIKYEGYVCARPHATRPYACVTVDNCWIVVGHRNEWRAMKLAERRQQYQQDMTEAECEEMLATFFGGEAGIPMHMDDVTEDTPCGDYYYDEED